MGDERELNYELVNFSIHIIYLFGLNCIRLFFNHIFYEAITFNNFSSTHFINYYQNLLTINYYPN